MAGLNLVPDKRVRVGMHEHDAPESRQKMRSCPVCGIRYFADPVRLKHGRELTCSRTCLYTLRASLRTAPFFTKLPKKVI